ncbi:glycosyltransferase family 2 protein [Proteus terrae]|nr:glycosyltransferase family 2 protein [Proteus terrae]
MPAFNSDSVITQSIESVLNQTHANFELIICDDLSTDNTKEIIKKYVEKDSRIKLIGNANKKGAAGARNSCIQASTSRYICFLDSDDLWAPEKLEKQIDFMREHNIAMSHSDYIMFDTGKNKK